MQERKQKLIAALNLAVSALKNNTIYYNWERQESCNCGVVAQAVLGKSAQQVKDLWLKSTETRIKVKRPDEKIDPTWQDSVKHLCPMTGEPLTEVFKQLFSAGLSKEDIVHLEYMDNPAILKRSGINTKKTIPDTQTKKVKVKKDVITSKPFLGIFGKVKIKSIEVEEEQIVNIDKGYYQSKENLILYLSAWLQILKTGSEITEANTTDINSLTTIELESELLNAVAEENYEYATKIKEQLNSIK